MKRNTFARGTEKFPRHVPDSDGMNSLTRWLTDSGCVAQARSSLNLSSIAPNNHECNVPAITVGSLWSRGEGPAATSLISSEAGYSCGVSIQTTSRPDHVWPDAWIRIGKATQRRETQDRAIEKPNSNMPEI